MAYTNLAPRTRNITGASLTGSDGAKDRTYDIPDDSVLSSGLDIVINGSQLMEGASYDFTLSGETLTFLNIVDNTDVIRINYFKSLTSSATSSISVSSGLRYSSTTQLANTLGILEKIPSWDVSAEPTNEEVGTGTGSKTLFYLDQQNVLSESYTLYYGADASTTTELTETTHYSLDATKGKITLTAAGVTLLSTSKIYAEYSYVSNSMSDSYLVTVLQRAEQEVDNLLNTTFIDGTASNPSYSSTTEYQPSRGQYNQMYFVNHKPLQDVESTLDGDLTAIATSVPLASGDGTSFPSTGYIVIGSEVIKYTGITTDTLTGCTRASLGSTAAAHTDADEVHTTVIQLSGTQQGSTPTWETQTYHSDFVAKEDHVYVYKEILSTNQTTGNSVLAAQDVENRIRLVYLYGHDTIPVDITRLTILLAKRQLQNDTISTALVQGRNEFRPEMTNTDQAEMLRITYSYRNIPMQNT